MHLYDEASLTISSRSSTSTTRMTQKSSPAYHAPAPGSQASGYGLPATRGCLATRNVMAAIETFIRNRSPQDDRIGIRPCVIARAQRARSAIARQKHASAVAGHRPHGHDRGVSVHTGTSQQDDAGASSTVGSAIRTLHAMISKLWRVSLRTSPPV